MRICSISGCDRKHLSRGWCNKHYLRWKVHGDPEKTTVFQSPEEAFKNNTKWVGDCLEWTRGKTANGYGKIWADKKTQLAHRYAWERVNGPIPDGVLVDHICHNKICCNIEHLRLATNAQNQWNRNTEKSSSATGMLNIYFKHGKYEAGFMHLGKSVYLGRFDSQEDAAEAVRTKRKELQGEFYSPSHHTL